MYNRKPGRPRGTRRPGPVKHRIRGAAAPKGPVTRGKPPRAHSNPGLPPRPYIPRFRPWKPKADE